MSVTFQIPTEAKFIPTSTKFDGVFGVPTPGVYDFTSNAANQNVSVLTLEANTVYMIDRINVGANISEEQFLGSINSFPVLYMKKKQKNKNLYKFPVPIGNLIDNGEMTNFFYTDNRDDELIMTFEGILNQLASMVGIATVTIQISLNIYMIDSAWFVGSFRDRTAKTIGQKNRR